MRSISTDHNYNYYISDSRTRSKRNIEKKCWKRWKETRVSDRQFGFMYGRSTMKEIYLLRRVMDQYQMNKKDLNLVFINLGKACEIGRFYGNP